MFSTGIFPMDLFPSIPNPSFKAIRLQHFCIWKNVSISLNYDNIVTKNVARFQMLLNEEEMKFIGILHDQKILQLELLTGYLAEIMTW